MEHEQPSQPTSTYGDGLSIAFELVGTPSIFALIGFGLDRWAGTSPLFTVALTALALATVIGLTIWRYGLAMDHADSERRAARTASGRRPARWEQHRPERFATPLDTASEASA